MRKLKAVLLAAAAVTAGIPAMASAQRWGQENNQNETRGPRGGGDRPDRGQGGGDQRPDRGPGGGDQRPDRGDFQRAQADQARAQQEQARAQQEQARAQQEQARAQQEQMRAQQQQQQAQQQQAQQRQQFDRGGDRRPDFNPGDRGGRPDMNRGPDPRRGDFRPDDRRPDNNRPDFRRDDNRRPDFRPGDNRGPGFDGRPGFGNDRRPDFRGDPGRGGNFSREWRQDRRYDWQGYRNQNRSLFRAPRYVAPRNWGYGYRRFSIGVVMPSFFFGEQYWIDDPWEYRLPPAYGPYRWIRYYNDVLLIDLRNGRVVDAIPDFFW